MRSTTRRGDTRQGVVRGLARTARVITSAALIMIFVFGAFVLNSSPEVKMFGLGLAFAVLVDATIVRMMLVPSIMEILGDANWWFPKWLGFLPRLDIDGDTAPAPAPEPEPEPVPERVARMTRTADASSFAVSRAARAPSRSGGTITACSPRNTTGRSMSSGCSRSTRDHLLLGLVVAGVETELLEPLVLAHQRRRRVGDRVDDPLEVGARRVAP